MPYYCPLCDARVVPVERVTAIYQAGQWWCAKHAKVRWDNGYCIVTGPEDAILEFRKEPITEEPTP